MIAEIMGKINRENTNLTELREDELTGNFFGNLRYLSFNKGMKKILRNAIHPTELQGLIDEIDADNWDENLFLWEKVIENGKITELDVQLKFPSIVIGIEVKYCSGLSSEDGKEDENISCENSVNQLSREARVLDLIGSGRKKVLLLLADDLSCTKIIKDVKIVDNVELGYFSWQEVLLQLKKLTNLSDFEQLVISDLIELLEKKGFSRFSNFEFEAEDVCDTGYWNFTPNKFGFRFDKIVEEKSYEFR